MSEPEPPPDPDSWPPPGLDPERAAARSASARRGTPEPVIDTRRYRWMIGIFGLALVAAFSVYLFTMHGIQSTGVAVGKALPRFVAPLATSSLNGDANVNPRCNPRAPNPRALNVCGRNPVALGLFVTGSDDCKNEIDTLQRVAAEFRSSGITFAAVAVDAGHSKAAALVRAHHWTIPVAYDRDGAIGAVYGVAICPMVELARRGGVVTDRLIGNHWLSAPALAAAVRRSLARGG